MPHDAVRVDMFRSDMAVPTFYLVRSSERGSTDELDGSLYACISRARCRKFSLGREPGSGYSPFIRKTCHLNLGLRYRHGFNDTSRGFVHDTSAMSALRTFQGVNPRLSNFDC